MWLFCVLKLNPRAGLRHAVVGLATQAGLGLLHHIFFKINGYVPILLKTPPTNWAGGYATRGYSKRHLGLGSLIGSLPPVARDVQVPCTRRRSSCPSRAPRDSTCLNQRFSEIPAAYSGRSHR